MAQTAQQIQAQIDLVTAEIAAAQANLVVQQKSHDFQVAGLNTQLSALHAALAALTPPPAS